MRLSPRSEPRLLVKVWALICGQWHLPPPNFFCKDLAGPQQDPAILIVSSLKFDCDPVNLVPGRCTRLLELIAISSG
jgi:hypothetical protein